MSIKNRVQLITYPNSLGGDLKTLHALLLDQLAGLFPGGIHILPPFPSSGDRGFAPLTYNEIDPAFGTWEDIRRIGQNYDVVVDLMVNHMSRRSPYFQDFLKRGRNSAHADLFITLDKVWPAGDPPPADVATIFLRKPENPFSSVVVEETGRVERIWTTFGKRDWSEQIDLDVRSAATRALLAGYLTFFSRHGIKIVRLDAIGYVIKKPGTSCFMVEPEIYEFIDWLVEVAGSLGLEVLPEVHAHHSVQARLADHGYWVYDFVLPMLILHTLFRRSASQLAAYLATCSRRRFTMLDCHDGIPVRPDLDGILSVPEMRNTVDICLGRGANLSRILSAGRAPDDCDAHQINCTYYSALGCDDDAYLAARALQFFAPGVPQVYYAGLLAAQNDHVGVQATGEGRAVNRHNYSVGEVEQALRSPIVQRLLALIRIRNEHPAFDGDFQVSAPTEKDLVLAWRKEGHLCRLAINLEGYRATIACTDDLGRITERRV